KLNPKTRFKAVACGGWKPKGDRPRISMRSVERYFETEERLKEIKDSSAYKKIQAQTYIPGRRNLKREKRAEEKLKAMIKKEIDYLHHKRTGDFVGKMSDMASYWLHEALYKRAEKSGFIEIVGDYRFQDA